MLEAAASGFADKGNHAGVDMAFLDCCLLTSTSVDTNCMSCVVVGFGPSRFFGRARDEPRVTQRRGAALLAIDVGVGRLIL